jgi:hypothetical protein
VLDRLDREDDRGKALDAKITAVLAGITACLGLAVRVRQSVALEIETMFYFIPLSVSLSAFLVRRGASAPTAESLETFFPEFPVTTMRDAVTAVTRACRENIRINDRKAARLDIAVALMALLTAVVLVTLALPVH